MDNRHKCKRSLTLNQIIRAVFLNCSVIKLVLNFFHLEVSSEEKEKIFSCITIWYTFCITMYCQSAYGGNIENMDIVWECSK